MMAPQKVFGASKKQKTGGRTYSQPRKFDSSRFKGDEQAERFKELEKGRFGLKKCLTLIGKGHIERCKYF